MSKLFVITYKRPAVPIEKMTMNIEDAYDCESTHNEELAKIRYRDARNRYDEVEMFECEEYEFVEFMKNDDAVTHFTRTGEHSMKPVEGIEEDVEVGIDKYTGSIHLILEMTRPTKDTPFDYHVDIDDVGQIVFTPDDPAVEFVDIRRLSGYDSVVDVTEGNKRSFSVTLTANMISDSDNFDWFCDVDEIGQAVVTPDADDTSFLSVSIEDSLNLVTESVDKVVLEALEPGSEEFNARLQECSERVTTLEGLFESAISIAKDIENDFRALGCHSADIDGYMIRYLENFIEDREGEVSCADFIRRLEEVTSPTTEEPVEESVDSSNASDIVLENDIVMENVDEFDRHNIIDRFMKGDISIFSEDGEPTANYVHLDELDTVTGKTSYKYYYDEESDAIVCYSGRAPKNAR